MATFTNTAKNTGAHRLQEKSAGSTLLEIGMPIGLLLALTHASQTIINTGAWDKEKKNTTWTAPAGEQAAKYGVAIYGSSKYGVTSQQSTPLDVTWTATTKTN